ncbi:MAG: LysR family transcriptional regulator [Nocardioides sp.]|nr:LysR family transcriptional regulator [Nocardioides sp.]
MGGVETRLLRSYVVLAEERHFGRAAARPHLAQPALSQQLKALEAEVGVRLLDRSTRRVDLTDAGRLLLTRAREVLAALDRTTGDLRLLGEGLAGRVAVGFVGTATYDVLPRLVRRVRADLPDLRLDVRGELLGPALLDEVASGSLDLAVLRPGPSTPAGLVVEPLRSEALVAVLPAQHPLAGADGVRLADLAVDPLVTQPGGRRSTMQPRVLDVYREAGVVPREVLEVSETGTLVAFVAAGLGVGLVPASVRALRHDGVAYVPLDDPRTEVPLALVRRDDAGPAALRVAEAVRAVAG